MQLNEMEGQKEYDRYIERVRQWQEGKVLYEEVEKARQVYILTKQDAQG